MLFWESLNQGGIQAGFSLRTGGVSSAPFNSLNLGLHVQDRPEDVIENRKRLCASIDVPFEALTFADQVHGNRVHVVRMNERGRGRLAMEDCVAQADALVTQEKEVMLAAVFADCVPIWFADHEAGVIAIAHAGWKGTVLGVAAETVKTMIAECGAELKRIRAVIGPAIGKCCYEVDAPVADAVMPWLSGMDEAAKNSVLSSGKSLQRFHLDLKQLNRQIIMNIGVSPDAIHVSSECTACDTGRFYSHRAEGGRTGRMAGWIVHKEAEGVR